MKKNYIKFYNINFCNLDFNSIYKIIMKGGYLVAPAASALSRILDNKIYHESLIHSNIAIFDSGFFCILLRIFKFEKVEKLYGSFYCYTFGKTNHNQYQYFYFC